MSSYPNKIHATVKVNDRRCIQMKADKGADTCILITDDVQRLRISVDIKPCSRILKGYEGNLVQNMGTINLQITFRNTSITTKLTIVEASGHPSMIGCQQAQELGIITINVEDIFQSHVQHSRLSNTWSLQSYRVKRISGLFQQSWPVPWGSISH